MNSDYSGGLMCPIVSGTGSSPGLKGRKTVVVAAAAAAAAAAVVVVVIVVYYLGLRTV